MTDFSYLASCDDCSAGEPFQNCNLPLSTETTALHQRLTMACVPLLVLLAIWFVVTVNSSAKAQQRGPRGRVPFRELPNTVAALAFASEVQSEIELSDQQQELLLAIQDDLSNQFRVLIRQGFRGRSNRPPASGEETDRLAGIHRIWTQGDDLVISVLEPHQTKRLQELQLQREGILAFERAEIVEQLELTDDQVEKIRLIRETNGERVSEPRKSQGEADGNDSVATIDDQVLSILTDKQKTVWDTLKGKAFKFPRDERRRDFRGRRSRDRPSSRRPSQSD